MKDSKIVKFIKKHKVEIIATGLVIGVITGAVLFLRSNKASVVVKSSSLGKLAEPTATSVHDVLEAETSAKRVYTLSSSFQVSQHPRNLPSGHNPSPKKLETAATMGIELKPNQTWVETFTKGSNATQPLMN